MVPEATRPNVSFTEFADELNTAVTCPAKGVDVRPLHEKIYKLREELVEHYSEQQRLKAELESSFLSKHGHQIKWATGGLTVLGGLLAMGEPFFQILSNDASDEEATSLSETLGDSSLYCKLGAAGCAFVTIGLQYTLGNKQNAMKQAVEAQDKEIKRLEQFLLVLKEIQKWQPQYQGGKPRYSQEQLQEQELVQKRHRKLEEKYDDLKRGLPEDAQQQLPSLERLQEEVTRQLPKDNPFRTLAKEVVKTAKEFHLAHNRDGKDEEGQCLQEKFQETWNRLQQYIGEDKPLQGLSWKEARINSEGQISDMMDTRDIA